MLQGNGVMGLLPRAVILEIDGTGGDANLFVSIWHPDKVASMLEVSREGDIRQAVLDELHPPGQCAQAGQRRPLGRAACIPRRFGVGVEGCSRKGPCQIRSRTTQCQ
jgi:hypothetical protein